jgi:hypothetical protein
MNLSVAEQFVVLSLHPEKGRVIVNSTAFSYSLTGALLMDYLEKSEITTANKRLIPSISKNGEIIHDMFADKIMEDPKSRRISYWIRRLTRSRRLILREVINSLEKKNIIRTEERKFLNIIPYKRYWQGDARIRYNLIESLRNILLYGKKPEKKEYMLLGLIEASKAYFLLSTEWSERRVLRRKNAEFLKGDIISSEIGNMIREVHAAIVASVIAATAAAHASH